MPLLRVEAEKLSENTLERGVIEEIIDRDDLFALVPFMQVNSKAYLYNREATLSEGEFLDVYETIPEGAATFTEVVAKLRILAGDVDLDKFLMATMSDAQSQLAIQLAAKAKGLGRKFRRTLINGDNAVNAKEFDGLKKLVPAGQTLVAGTNGNAVALNALDELLDAVTLGADCLMMRKGTWRAIRALLRATGGLTPDMIMIENFGKPVPAYNGVPVIINDFITGDEVQGSGTATTSIYAVRLNETDGFHAIYGGGSAGIVVEDIGTVQNKDSHRHRVKWYAGTALKATHAVARLKGITNV
jgi:HK97 family phage major capsid protein